jgi:hypothetical protein
MRYNKRLRERASSTPVYDRGSRPGFLWALAKVILLPLGIYVAISVYGLPALRLRYTYFGPEDYRQFVHCDYLTVNGIVRIDPAPGINQCGLIELFPAF